MPRVIRVPLHLVLPALLATISLAGCGTDIAPSMPRTADPTSTVRTPSPVTTAAIVTEPTTTPIQSMPAVVRNPAALTGPAPYDPPIDPADFVPVIDNPYLPWIPGTTWTYEGAGERIEITVTSDTKVVLGVQTTVVRDQVFVGKRLLEDTLDWYAQDRAGNVWYFGEATLSYEKEPAGDPAGSWEAGVNGAKPGIVMLADPQVGDVYRQEYLLGEAEDLAMVRDVSEPLTVAIGAYEDVIVTEEWTPLTPEQIEHKYYARGVGMIGERVVAGDPETIDLVAYHPS